MDSNVGWKCPRCWCCYAPFVSECPKCSTIKVVPEDEEVKHPSAPTYKCPHANSYPTYHADGTPKGNNCPECGYGWEY